MILTPHAIIGAALANAFPNEPALGFSLAFFSHYVLDMIPHTDYDISNYFNKDTKTVNSIIKNAAAAFHFLFIVLDLIFGVFLCFVFFVRDEKSAMITLLGIIGGLLPDFFQFVYFKYKKQPWIFLQKIHDKIHRDVNASNELLWGILFQFALPVLVLIIYFIAKR